jgi:anti-sigma B factor antagonist
MFRRWRTATPGRGAGPSDEIEVRIVPGHAESLIGVVGQVTVDSSPRLRAVLHEGIRAGTGRVLVVDFSRVSHCDTAGIATLLEAAGDARAHRARLRVIGMQGEVKELAEVTELGEVFRAFGSEVVFT